MIKGDLEHRRVPPTVKAVHSLEMNYTMSLSLTIQYPILKYPFPLLFLLWSGPKPTDMCCLYHLMQYNTTINLIIFPNRLHKHPTSPSYHLSSPGHLETFSNGYHRNKTTQATSRDPSRATGIFHPKYSPSRKRIFKKKLEFRTYLQLLLWKFKQVPDEIDQLWSKHDQKATTFKGIKSCLKPGHFHKEEAKNQWF